MHMNRKPPSTDAFLASQFSFTSHQVKTAFYSGSDAANVQEAMAGLSLPQLVVTSSNAVKIPWRSKGRWRELSNRLIALSETKVL